MKHFLLAVLSFLPPVAVNGDPVDSVRALAFAKRFYAERAASANARQADVPFRLSDKIPYRSSTSASGRKAASEFLYYVFNVGQDNGFVIVAGDDASLPVLGYSLKGHFASDDMPQHMAAWMEQYAVQLMTIKNNHTSATKRIELMWQGQDAPDYSARRAAQTAVGPLLETTWNQNPRYNKFCPYDQRTNEQSVTGCVATAMAQIMRYHKHPNKGQGIKEYVSPNSGYLYMDFNKSMYDWNNMPEELGVLSSTAKIDAVAKLMLDCGVSLEMNYNSDGSSANTPTVANVLIENFNYANTARYVERKPYTDIEWNSLLRSELSAKRPVQYRGRGTGGGHSFVCDGYDEQNRFHFNWGWGGKSDGYFVIDWLNPGNLGTGGGNGGYNSDQGAVIGITPRANTNYNMSLYKPITINLRNGLINASLNVRNNGSSDFAGDFTVALYTYKNNEYVFYDFIETKQGYSLRGGNYVFTNDLIFQKDNFVVSQGKFYAAAFYRETNGGWQQLEAGSYSNPVEVSFVGATNDIQLYSELRTSTNAIQQGQPFNVWVNLINRGSRTFSGEYSIDLYRMDGTWVTQVSRMTESNLQPAYRYTNDLSFTGSVNVPVGNYLLAISSKPSGGSWMWATSQNGWYNPIKVSVTEAPLYADVYENNDTETNAHKFKPTIDENKIVLLQTSGANLHTGSDYDYYDFELDPTCTHIVTGALFGKASGSYTADALLSYKTSQGWVTTDGNLANKILLKGENKLSLLVAPQYAGFKGTYNVVLNVIKIAKPVITVNGSNTVCSGQSVSLNVPAGYTLYRWYKDGKLFTEGSQTSVNVKEAGTYTIAAVLNDVEGPLSNTVSVSINPAPTAPVAESVRYCQNEPTAPLSATGTSLKWFGPGLLGGGTADVPKPSSSQAGRQRFVVTQTVGGCESPSREVFVDVDATPATPSVADLSACQNKPAPALTANGSGLLWYEAATGGTGDKITPLLSTTATGSQAVYVSQVVGRCEGPRAKLTITTYSVPSQPTAGTIAAVCRLSTAAPLVAQGQNIRWYTQAEGGTGSTQAPLPNTGVAGTLAFFATQTVNGCESDRLKLELRVKPQPTAQLIADSVLYRYDSLRVQIALTGDAPWQLTLWNNQSINVSQSPFVTYVKPLQNTSYKVQEVRNECGVGTSGNTLAVRVLEPLAAHYDNLRLTVRPNPVTVTIRAYWSAPSGQSVVLRLLGVSGQVVSERQRISTGSEQQEDWEVTGLSAGLYVVQLSTDQGNLTQRIIKQ